MKLLTHDTDGDARLDLWGSMLDIAWEHAAQANFAGLELSSAN